MKQKLKPCPFCDSLPQIDEQHAVIWCDSNECPMSTVQVDGKDINDAVTRWNFRSELVKADDTENSNENTNILEENKRLKNEVADLKEALGLAHTLEPREEVDWDQKYNRLKDDYNILQAQYKMALEGVASNSSFSKSTEIYWEQRKWDFVSYTLSLYLAENGTQYMQRDRCGNPIGEKDRNFTSIITDYIAVADKLINQLKQQNNEKQKSKRKTEHTSKKAGAGIFLL